MSKRTWSDEQLREAVREARSYREVLARLGLAISEVVRVRRRIKVLALDISHFASVRARGTGKRRWSDRELAAAVQQSVSVAQVIRRLGLIPAGGNYDAVQRRIEALVLDTSHFTGMRAGLRRGTPPRPLQDLLVADLITSSHKLKQRLIREGIKQPRCERCGWAERAPDGRVPLELDHVNGDRSDNRLVNLRILCPNCHALQPTHRGLNQKRRGSAASSGSRRIRTDT
jgi:hypothetical protein